MDCRCTYLEGGPEDEAGWCEVVALLHFATEDDDLLEEEHATVFCANVARFRRATRVVFVARDRPVMQQLALCCQLPLNHKQTP